MNRNISTLDTWSSQHLTKKKTFIHTSRFHLKNLFLPGSCGWTFLNTNDNIWKRGRNITEDSGVDYVYDHTLGTDAGYFVYTSEQPSDIEGPAVMVTNPHHNSHLQCAMEFWWDVAPLAVSSKRGLYDMLLMGFVFACVCWVIIVRLLWYMVHRPHNFTARIEKRKLYCCFTILIFLCSK